MRELADGVQLPVRGKSRVVPRERVRAPSEIGAASMGSGGEVSALSRGRIGVEFAGVPKRLRWTVFKV
jgi:hypothetical protein